MRGDPARWQGSRRFWLRARPPGGRLLQAFSAMGSPPLEHAMRPFWRASLPLVLLLLTPALAQPAWQPDGNRIGAGQGFVATASGPDRVIVTWSRRDVSVEEVRAQAFTADGELVSGWPPDGALVLGGSLGAAPAAVVEDGAGGAFVAWSVLDGSNSTVRVQHLSASGSVAAGWPAEGEALGASSVAALAADGAGGVLVARSEYFQGPDYYLDYRVTVHRIDAAGTPTPGWPVDGLQFPHTYEAGLLVDANHHVFVSTLEYNSTPPQTLEMIVRRLQENGAPDPAWPTDGVLLDDGRDGSRPQLFSDGAGGAFPEWSRVYVCIDICPYIPSNWAARVLDNGSTHSGWIPPRN